MMKWSPVVGVSLGGERGRLKGAGVCGGEVNSSGCDFRAPVSCGGSFPMPLEWPDCPFSQIRLISAGSPQSKNVSRAHFLPALHESREGSQTAHFPHLYSHTHTRSHWRKQKINAWMCDWARSFGFKGCVKPSEREVMQVEIVIRSKFSLWTHMPGGLIGESTCRGFFTDDCASVVIELLFV